MATRSGGIMGFGESWLKENGKIYETDDEKKAGWKAKN